MAMASVVIVGGGVAGLACARVLAGADIDVQIFDKGRGPGGRCSTRRSPFGGFDHGAPYFTAEDPRFLRQASRWVAAGTAQLWEPVVRGAPLPQPSVYVGTPGMNAIVKQDAKAHGVQFGVRIGPLQDHAGHAVLVRTETGEPLAEASFVVLATPAPQTAALLPDASPLKQLTASVAMVPRWTLMLALPEEVGADFDILLPGEGAIDKIIREPAKPGRDHHARYVVHATTTWSAEHLEDDDETVTLAIMTELKRHVPLPAKPEHVAVHRWRYAEVTEPLGQAYGLDEQRRVATCGDGYLGSGVEAAYLSGYELGQALKERLSRP